MTPDEFTLPSAPMVEKAVLSCAMKSAATFARLQAEGIGADHFHHPANRSLFETLRDRIAAGQSIDIVSIAQDSYAGGTLDMLGGAGALAEILTYAPNELHLNEHLRILREHLAKRRAMVAAYQIVTEGEGMEPDQIASALSFALEGTSDALSLDLGMVTAKEACERLADHLKAQNEAEGEIPGIPTGIDPIDIVTGGMRPGQLWVVAAETSGGKSVLMLQVAAHFVASGKRVLVVSLEMTAEEVIQRMICTQFRASMSEFNRKAKSRDFLVRAQKAIQQFAPSPLKIDDRGGRNLDQIAGNVQKFVDIHGGIDLLVIDYLQLVECQGKRNYTREQELSNLCRRMKGLAKKFRVPIFTASQLNDDGKLRESREIGMTADVILGIEEDGIRALKVRNGPRGQLFPLKLNGEIQRFER